LSTFMSHRSLNILAYHVRHTPGTNDGGCSPESCRQRGHAQTDITDPLLSSAFLPESPSQ
jgi:hypothetical protein